MFDCLCWSNLLLYRRTRARYSSLGCFLVNDWYKVLQVFKYYLNNKRYYTMGRLNRELELMHGLFTLCSKHICSISSTATIKDFTRERLKAGYAVFGTSDGSRWYASLIRAWLWLAIARSTNDKKIIELSMEKVRYYAGDMKFDLELGKIITDDFLNKIKSLWVSLLKVNIKSAKGYCWFKKTPTGRIPVMMDELLSDFEMLLGNELESPVYLSGLDCEDFMHFKDGWKWVTICSYDAKELEGKAMRHCGRGFGDIMYSLREPIDINGEIHWKPHLTFTSADGEMIEMRGRGNSIPSPRYHRKILELFFHPSIKAIGGFGVSWKERNFQFRYFSSDMKEELLLRRPDLLVDPFHQKDLECFLKIDDSSAWYLCRGHPETCLEKHENPTSYSNLHRYCGFENYLVYKRCITCGSVKYWAWVSAALIGDKLSELLTYHNCFYIPVEARKKLLFDDRLKNIETSVVEGDSDCYDFGWDVSAFTWFTGLSRQDSRNYLKIHPKISTWAEEKINDDFPSESEIWNWESQVFFMNGRTQGIFQALFERCKNIPIRVDDGVCVLCEVENLKIFFEQMHQYSALREWIYLFENEKSGTCISNEVREKRINALMDHAQNLFQTANPALSVRFDRDKPLNSSVSICFREGDEWWAKTLGLEILKKSIRKSVLENFLEYFRMHYDFERYVQPVYGI